MRLASGISRSGPIPRTRARLPLVNLIVVTIVDGSISQLLQATLTRCQPRRRLNAGDPKDLLPSIDPVVTQQRFRRVALADCLESPRLRTEVGQHIENVGSVRFDWHDGVWPVERFSERL